MEISDWRTRGLGGPSRANVLPKPREHNDFVNFVRNMGARRDMAGGGGTYGYGKSSLYQLSRCATVLVDSVSLHSFRAVRSPLHWMPLGRCPRQQAPWPADRSPLVGRGRCRRRGRGRSGYWSQRRSAAEGAGLPDRGADATGTTLVVLDPDLEDRPLEIAAEIRRRSSGTSGQRCSSAPMAKGPWSSRSNSTESCCRFRHPKISRHLTCSLRPIAP